MSRGRSGVGPVGGGGVEDSGVLLLSVPSEEQASGTGSDCSDLNHVVRRCSTLNGTVKCREARSTRYGDTGDEGNSSVAHFF